MGNRFQRTPILGAVAPHTFIPNAPEAGIAIAVSLSTESRVVRFTPTRAGTYPSFCGRKPPPFPSHRQQGMEGMLEVLP
jgi:hypothetical protein